VREARYAGGVVSDSSGAEVAEALGLILQRDFRAGLYRDLTTGLHTTVDAATYPVLSGLDRYGPSTAATLGQRIGLDRSIVSRRASRLVTAGLLDAGSDPNDARGTVLALTTAGEETVAVMRRRLAAAIDRRMSAWDERDRTVFAALLQRFAAGGPLR
jgi:DNA-binding MarR family transcriptional regulator